MTLKSYCLKNVLKRFARVIHFFFSETRQNIHNLYDMLALLKLYKGIQFLILSYIEHIVNSVSIHLTLTLYTMQKFNKSYRDVITGIAIKTCGVSFSCADLHFCKVLA